MARKPFDPSLARGGLFDGAPPVEQAKPAERPALSVSQAAEMLKGTLMGLGRVRIQGEVGQAGGGTHCYFTLKDESATVNCVMWASTLSRSAVKPEQGVEVIVEGTFDYYGPSGRLSLIVDRMRHVGEGDLEARFRALCNELRALGWFDDARKRPLPLVPRGIAIITAPGSAALADCLKIAATRFPSVPLTVIGVKVQGSDAAAEVVRAIERVNAAADALGVEVIVVTRGGGSREDLQAFNERAVAEAVFHSRLPLVAAIGHESDTSVIELVADLRASTPTQAMVAVLPDRRELLAQVQSISARLAMQVRQQVAMRRQRLRGVATRACLRDPLAMLVFPRQRLARVRVALRHAAASVQRGAVDRVRALDARLRAHSPAAVIGVGRARSLSLDRRLALAATNRLSAEGAALQALRARIESVAPERTLARGYSITLDPSGQPIRDAARVPPGTEIVTRLERGELRSRTEGSR